MARPEGDGTTDTEKDEVAVDTGAGGGGFSAEEAAIHELPPDNLEVQQGEPEPYLDDQDPDEIATPPAERHRQPRTGAEQAWDPEDLAVAEGRDPTPENVERARRRLDELGPAAIERTVP